MPQRPTLIPSFAVVPNAGPTCRPPPKPAPRVVESVRTDLAPVSFQVAPVSTEKLMLAQANAIRQLESKAPPEQVIAQLAGLNLDRSTATALVNTLMATRYQVERKAARQTMIDGVLWAMAGVAVTIITLLIAQEKGGTYFIMWGPALIGGWQFVRSLSQYLRSRQPQSLIGPVIADPGMLAHGLGWPRPVLKMRTRLGSIALLGIFVVFALADRGTPLIDKQAADLNLNAAELGTSFSLTSERGPQAADTQELRDSNTRDFVSGGVYIRSAVVVGKMAYSDKPDDLINVFEKSMEQETSVVTAFDESQTMLIGDRGGVESFTMTNLTGMLQGYIVTFVQRNVIVMVIEMGPKDQIDPGTVQKHAKLIANRLP